MNHVAVTSTDGSAYLAWQTELLAFSHARAGQPGELAVLDDTVAVADDHYPPYNKPHALLRWARSRPASDAAVLILDPDMVFVRRWAPTIEPGRIIAHDSRYAVTGETARVLAGHVDRPDALAPVMVPLLVHSRDLAALAHLWLEATIALRRDAASRTALGWVTEMWGCAIAVHRLGLEVTLGSLAVHPPHEDGLRVPFVHYAYEVDSFDKRRYAPWAPLPPARNEAYGFVRAVAGELTSRRSPPARTSPG